MYSFKIISKGAMTMMIVIAPLLLSAQDSLHLKKGDEYFSSFIDYFGKNSDSVVHYLNLANREYLEGEYWEQYITTLNGYCSFYAQNNEYEISEKYANLALSESKKYFNETDLIYSTSLSNHSAFLMYTGNFKKAISQFKNCLAIERMHASDKMLIGSSLKNIGDAYNEVGDLDEALKYYNELIAYDEANDVFKQSSLARIYRRQGVAYFRKNEIDLSLLSFQNAKKALSNKKDKRNYLEYNVRIDINNDLAQIHLSKGNRDSLFYYINENFELCTGEYQIKQDEGYILLGTFYLNQGQYPEAIKNLRAAKSINATRFKKFKKHITFSQINMLLASAYAKTGDFRSSISLNIKAINNLKNSSVTNDTLELPTTDGISSPIEAINAYKQIGDAYDKLYDLEKDTKYLESSFQSFRNATSLIIEVRNSFQKGTSLLRYSEVAMPIYEAAIESTLKMYKNTGEIYYLIQAFNYNEKSKAILLLESINKSLASQFSGIPDSLKQKEKEFKLQISSLNRKLYDEQNVLEKENSFKIEQLERLLFSESEEYSELLRKLEKEYPEYYLLKYNNKTTTIEEIQQKLRNTDAQLIEFFSGNKNTFVFSISKNDFIVNTVLNQKENSSDLQKVKDFLNTPPSGKDMEILLKNYTISSKNVYERYLKDAIFPTSKHLIIISDGELGFLPFEALITALPKTEDVSFSLENLSYLMEDYLVSYSYSSTLFMKSLKFENLGGQNTFFGVAPSFGLLNNKSKTRICNENDLYSLNCSQDEVLQIKKMLGGKVLLGKEATLGRIQKEISNSRIIHLATHACLDDTNPEFNKIYLADDYLSNNDLYNLKLNSELAVLSACETGSGRLAKGEGVMSLARGFIHAGCPSIIMSLWSIDDCATSKIMIDFYEELYDGQSKTVALRNAKLKYIREAKRANQHPYYWAAFVQIGNYDPIEISSLKTNLLYAIAFLSFGLLVFLGLNKIKKT